MRKKGKERRRAWRRVWVWVRAAEVGQAQKLARKLLWLSPKLFKKRVRTSAQPQWCCGGAMAPIGSVRAGSVQLALCNLALCIWPKGSARKNPSRCFREKPAQRDKASISSALDRLRPASRLCSCRSCTAACLPSSLRSQPRGKTLPCRKATQRGELASSTAGVKQREAGRNLSEAELLEALLQHLSEKQANPDRTKMWKRRKRAWLHMFHVVVLQPCTCGVMWVSERTRDQVMLARPLVANLRFQCTGTNIKQIRQPWLRPVCSCWRMQII